MVSVVSVFGSDGREVVAVLERATVVEPVDPFSGNDLDVVIVAAPRLDERTLSRRQHRSRRGWVDDTHAHPPDLALA